MYKTIIDQPQFNDTVEELRHANPASHDEGFFGPKSLYWQINRHSLIFLGAGCAALLQLAHPFVAKAIFDHSIVKHSPYQRFINTFIPVFKLVYGNQTIALNTSQKIHAVHARIRGTLDNGLLYAANNLNALIWVYTTLIVTAIRLYELTHTPLTQAQKQQYYQESKRFAALFGIHNKVLPKGWLDLLAYYESMVQQQLTVTPTAIELANHLLAPKTILLKPLSDYYRHLTAWLLPAPISCGFNLPAIDANRSRELTQHLQRLGRFSQRLPDSLKYVPPYNEAKARLLKQKTPWLIRQYNYFIFKQANIANEEH